MEERTLKEIQKEVDVWASQFKKPYFEPLSQLASMIEEVGEISRILNIKYGDKNKKDSEILSTLEEELGDLFLNIVCLANSQNIDLTQACFSKLDKLYKRDNFRFERIEHEKSRS